MIINFRKKPDSDEREFLIQMSQPEMAKLSTALMVAIFSHKSEMTMPASVSALNTMALGEKELNYVFEQFEKVHPGFFCFKPVFVARNELLRQKREERKEKKS